MTPARFLSDVRTVERLRQAMRDVARLDLIQTGAALAEADRVTVARSEDLTEAVATWNDALGRPSPDPALFGLAGASVIRSEARYKAAVLDGKIAAQRRDDAATGLARAEAQLEGARMMRDAARRGRDNSLEARAGQQAEDAFLSRRRA